MFFVIHYRKDDGAIVCHGDDSVGGVESFRSDCAKLSFGESFPVNAQSQKIDLVTGAIVEKSQDERLDALLPQVKVAIAGELAATDQYMVSDRPLTEEMRKAWRVYRQALRDLKGDAVTIVDAWPPRLDGVDATLFLRAQVKG